MALFASSLVAQNPPYSIRVDVPLVSVDVMVSDSNGRPITNLTREDFSILEDGKPQTIQNFSPVDSPYSILLLIDRSIGMQDSWPLMAPALSRFIAQLKPQDRISIGAFDERSKEVNLLLDWRETRKQELTEIPIDPTVRGGYVSVRSGGTPRAPGDTAPGLGSVVSISGPTKDFYGALTWATERLRSVNGRKGTIVFTDGNHPRAPFPVVEVGGQRNLRIRDASDDEDFQKVLRGVRLSQTAFYFVAVNTDLNPLGRFSMDSINKGMPVRSRLEQLAGNSGGRVVFPIRLADTLKLCEDIGRDDRGALHLVSTPHATPRPASGRYPPHGHPLLRLP